MTAEGTDYITIVSGLPRSGTSMMMRMLAAGGMPVLTDSVRGADADNPNGYFELERVKRLDRDAAWLASARGKALKTVYLLLYNLPRSHRYRVIFMRRRLEEVIASQAAMLRRRQEQGAALEPAQLTRAFQQHLGQIEEWLHLQENLDVLYVDYNDVLDDPTRAVITIIRFLDDRLDANAMSAVVDPSLYRQRRSAADNG